MPDDAKLLADYVKNGSEDAFRQLSELFLLIRRQIMPDPKKAVGEWLAGQRQRPLFWTA